MKISDVVCVDLDMTVRSDECFTHTIDPNTHHVGCPVGHVMTNITNSCTIPPCATIVSCCKQVICYISGVIYIIFSNEKGEVGLLKAIWVQITNVIYPFIHINPQMQTKGLKFAKFREILLMQSESQNGFLQISFSIGSVAIR